MMNILKNIGKIGLVLTLLIMLTLAGWAIWERNRDPVATLSINPGEISVAIDSTLTSRFLTEEREYRHIILSTERIGDIEVFISFPLIRYTQQMPVIIVMGGLEIGIHNFRYITEPGNNAIIIYQYPYKTDQWRNNSAISQIPIIRKKILEIPAQILALTDWIAQQSWADQERINLSGYSFGSFFVPAIYHLDALNKQKLAPGVISYGGVDIYYLLMTNMKKTAYPLRLLGSWFAATAIYSVEPALHLPKMKNEFLIINGTLDHQIPTDSWKSLHQLVPDPKSIIILEEGHMHPRKHDLTLKLVNLSKKWLRERNVINP